MWAQTSNRSAADKMTMWFDTCMPYDGDRLVVDSALGMARASTILAPIFATIALSGNFIQSMAFSMTGKKVLVASSFMAFLFQAFTLLVLASQACSEAMDGLAFCTVGFSTWAFWTSVAGAVCFLGAFASALSQYKSESNDEEKKEELSSPSSPEESQAEQAIP